MAPTRPFPRLEADPAWTRSPAPAAKAVPTPSPVPAPAIDTGPLAQEEALLSHRERELEAREAAAGHDEVNAQADQAGIEGRCRALRRRLQALAASGVPGADALLASLPRPAPAPSVAERKRALNMRRAAIDARETAARRREEACTLLRLHLERSRSALSEAERRLGDLEVWPDRAIGSAATPAWSPAPLDVAPTPHWDGPKWTESERRGQRRARVDVRVGLETHDNFYSGFARDLSDGGLFVATFDTLPVGSAVDVGFELPDGTRVEARARVRWVRELTEATGDAWPGMGLAFESVPAAAAAAIERFMETREPIFFVD
jgi:uncharacterized protein (TIGR02266 family)